jgi:hypothetical protein
MDAKTRNTLLSVSEPLYSPSQSNEVYPWAFPKIRSQLERDSHISGDDTKARLYDAWYQATVTHRYKYHVVITPDYPLHDYDEAERIAQLLFRRIQRIYYGSLLDRKKRTPMPYLTVIEESAELCNNGKPKLHFHILLGEPERTRLDFSRIGIRWNYANPVSTLLSEQMYIRLGRYHRKGFGFKSIFCKPGTIDHQCGIVDYLLKQIEKNKLFVSLNGSNLDWSHLQSHHRTYLS